jgi:drug/metabolite transporter (DMT)-like permease
LEGGRAVAWNLPFTGLLLFLALAGTSFVTAAWYWLIQREDVGRLSLFFYLVPVFGLGIAVLTFGETISFFEMAGVGLALAGIGAAIGEGWYRRVGENVHLANSASRKPQLPKEIR